MSTPLSPDRSERIRSLFREVVDLAPDRRAAYLAQLREVEPGLCGEVESLLQGNERAGDVLHRLDQLLPWLLHSTGDETNDALIGRSVSHYQILEKLGAGGMGVVYRARDLKLDRTVAIKFLPPYLCLDEDAKQRFVQEAKAASALDHPNICTVYETGEADQGQAFIAMACYPGETLKKKIERGPLSVEEAIAFAAKVADGLAAAHEAGIVHRDVKPANVLVTTQGQVKLVDFGIAKAQGECQTRPGVTLGTVAYMSPEQTRGEPVDARTDLWSLGAVLYEMLTGKRPFRGGSDAATLYSIRHEAPEPVRVLRPEIPGALVRVVEQLLAKDPADRYQGAAELASDLRTIQGGGTVRQPTVPLRPSRRTRGLAYGGAAALFAALLAAVGLLSRSDGPAAIDSIAVLPVANLSGDPEQDPLADGMTDLLIHQLSQVSGLDRVISRTSMMPYKRTRKPPREIGRELGVDALIEASVLRDGERVRVNVGLVEAKTGQTVWSSSFERPIRDVLTLQRDVARAIALEVAVQLTPQEAGRLRRAAPEVDPQAFALYLEGTRWDRHTNPRERVTYLEQAVARDSNFALAYAMMADDYAVQLNDTDRAERAVERALALDPHLPRAHVTLGNVRQWAHGDWAGAEDALRRAVELAPLDARAHHELAMLLMRLGRFEEALVEERRTLYLEPTNAEFQAGLGEIYYHARRYDEAIRELEKAFQMDPDLPLTTYVLGEAHFFMGRYDEAVRWYERRLGIPPWAYAPLGRRAEALSARDSLLASVERGGPRTVNSLAGELALLYTSLGEHEQALDWLERAVDGWLGWVPVYLKVTPYFDPLRDEPRFQALLKKAGLAE